MNISLNLSDFKSAGVYIREYAMSESINLNSNTIRLIVGFSRKGKFNSPVFLRNAKDMKNIFGPIDTFLERRGSYFHRACYTALELGPIFALNLLALNDDPSQGIVDKVPYQSLSISSTELNGYKQNELYRSYYNTSGFWEADTRKFLGLVDKPASPNKGKLLNITNLSQNPISVIVTKTKSTEVSMFNITAKDWFSETGQVPSYIDEYDFISDYFINVTILQGNWTNYISLSVDPIYGKYFDRKGIRKDKLREFLALPEVKSFGTFTGSIIPDLRDGSGVSYSIDTIINQNLPITGAFIAINTEALEEYDVMANDSDTDNISGVDVVGHNIANSREILGSFASADTRNTPNMINFLSYSFGIKDSYTFTEKNSFNTSVLEDSLSMLKDSVFVEDMSIGKKYGYFENVIKIQSDPNWSSTNPLFVAYEKIKNNVIPGTSVLKRDSTSTTTSYLTIQQAYEITENGNKVFVMLLTHPLKRNESTIFSTNNFYTFTNSNDPADSDDIVSITNPLQNADFGRCVEINVLDDWFTGKSEIDLTSNYLYLRLKNSENTVKGYKVVNISSVITVDEVDVRTLTVQLPPNAVLSTATINANDDVANRFDIYHVAKTVAAFPPVPNHNSSGINTIHICIKPDSLIIEADGGNNVVKSYTYNTLANYIANNVIQTGDMVEAAYVNAIPTTDSYIKIGEGLDDDGILYNTLKLYRSYNTVYSAAGIFEGIEFEEADRVNFQFVNHMLKITDSGVSDIGGSGKKYYNIVTMAPNSKNLTGTKFSVSVADAQTISNNDYIVSQIETDEPGVYRYKLAKIISMIGKYTTDGNTKIVEITLNTPVFEPTPGTFVRFSRIDDVADIYKVFYLDGFKLTDAHMPGTKKSFQYSEEKQLIKILEVLNPMNTSLIERLSSIDMIDFRYVIDTFDGGLSPMTYPKTWLTKLAKERQQCLAIMNAPSIRKFMESNNPRFTQIPTDANPLPDLDTYYIAAGANMELNPAYTFSLPDEEQGAKFSGYFSPFIVIRENGRNFTVPPAALISNLYVRKHLNGEPFKIVAGTRRGVISEPKMIGLEYDFQKRDRDNLEPMGINPIINIPGTGYTINANKMAYQKTQNAFNSLHVRDILITIERDLTVMLRHYLFEPNNDAIRLEIKNRVDAYLDKVRTLEGIYRYETRMSAVNNPSEVINSRMGIIDIYVEPMMGLEKVLANVIVGDNGSVGLSGFNNVFL